MSMVVSESKAVLPLWPRASWPRVGPRHFSESVCYCSGGKKNRLLYFRCHGRLEHVDPNRMIVTFGFRDNSLTGRSIPQAYLSKPQT